MSQPTSPEEINFDWETVARALVKEHGITDGIWRISLRLRFGGVTAGWAGPTSPSNQSFVPTGIVGVESVSLVRATSLEQPLAFDAVALLAPKARARPAKASATAKPRRKVKSA